ncbi:MAG: molecular chaperone DnaJ, partial [Candidatus Thermoplasmatota archaeon]|nr:molecular chaperone DnaJ [Candidatus Thermoplasmatota archaeon]
PHLRGAGRGDQYVRVILETPRQLSSEHKDLMHRMMEMERASTDERTGKKGSGIFHRKKNGK